MIRRYFAGLMSVGQAVTEKRSTLSFAFPFGPLPPFSEP